MCVFNGGFMRLGQDFSRFARKDISCRMRNQMLDKIVFRHSRFFSTFSRKKGHSGKHTWATTALYQLKAPSHLNIN